MQTKPTKANLIAQINAIVSEYLGFPTEVSGLKSRRVDVLIQYCDRMTAMIRLKREADQINSQWTSEQRICFALSANPPAEYATAAILLREASNIWLGARIGK